MRTVAYFIIAGSMMIGGVSSNALSQLKWRKTAYNPIPASRINDGFFLNSTVGWVVNGVGQINRTTDGGDHWLKQFENSHTHFRSVGFFDSLNGFAGCLGWGDPNNTASTDTNLVYGTTNGGATWLPVTSLSSATIKRGFCGMRVLNRSEEHTSELQSQR